MKRLFFLAVALLAASGFVLPLAQPARANRAVTLRGTPSFDHYGTHSTTSPVYKGWGDGKPVWYIITDAFNVSETRKLGVAKLDRYVFKGWPDLSQQRSSEARTVGFLPDSFNPRSAAYLPLGRVGVIAGVWDAPVVASDSEPQYALNRFSPLLSMEVLPAQNAPRITDFAVITVQGARPAGFTVNYPNVIQIIRL